MMQFHRQAWLLAGFLAAAALAGCEAPGLSGRDAELSRLRSGKDFQVIGVAADRAVFSARQQRIIVEPPEGYCLDEDSVAATRNAAFALITDCLNSRQTEAAQGTGSGTLVEIDMPRVFPGILTVSVSGEPAYGPGPGAMDAFEVLLGAEAGLKLLSRGNGSGRGRIVATRRIGGALYVLIEEPQGEGASFLAPRFWRAFININQRLVLVTVNSFQDRPLAEDTMMGFIAQQMTRLRQANGLPADEEEDEIARQMAETLGAGQQQGGLTAVRSNGAPAPSGRANPARSPMPRERVISTGVPPEPDPILAPHAPQRPG